MQEAIAICERISGNTMNTVYRDENRVGDHIWWVSGLHKFQHHYPDWKLTYGTERILEEVYRANVEHLPPKK
jgi:CDP-paratose 2-epimerase